MPRVILEIFAVLGIVLLVMSFVLSDQDITALLPLLSLIVVSIIRIMPGLNLIQNLLKFGNTSYVPQLFSWRVNDFWITYTKEIKTNQFYSDLSLLNNQGFEIKRKTIFVNEPFIYKNVTLYQTDWDILGLKVKLDKDTIIQIPLIQMR